MESPQETYGAAWGGGQTSEADGSIDFELNLAQASTETVTVGVSTRDGTEVAASDYAALSTDVTFQPGQQSRTVTVDDFEDTSTEGDEVTSTLRRLQVPAESRRPDLLHPEP